MCNVQLSAEHPSVLQHEKFNTTTFAKWMFRLKKDVPDLDPDSVIENWFYRACWWAATLRTRLADLYDSKYNFNQN